MKPLLPHNLLLAVTIAVTGLVVLYNVALRDSFSATLLYAYPAVEEPAASSLPAPARSEPDAVQEEETFSVQEWMEADVPEEPGPLTSVDFPLELNGATEEQLKFIPQVGDVMAQRIVQYRDHLGGYSDLEQLRGIKGVGDKTYEHLYTYLYLDREPESGEEDPQEPDMPLESEE